MAILKSVRRLTFVVEDIRQWAWFYIDVLGGVLKSRIDASALKGGGVFDFWTITLYDFEISLIGVPWKYRSVSSLPQHGDSFLSYPMFVVEGKDMLRQQSPQLLDSSRFQFTDTARDSLVASGKGLLEQVDHLTYVVSVDTIERWRSFLVDSLGGSEVLKCDDVDPEGKSSMMLWCIDFGSFGIALVAGIDREEQSHVSAFCKRHGDFSIQHAAYRVAGSLNDFLNYARDRGVALLGRVLERNDGLGWLQQVFARGYHGAFGPAEVGFPEFLKRPTPSEGVQITFDATAGTELYRQAQRAMEEDNRTPLIDFSAYMPRGWQPPAPLIQE